MRFDEHSELADELPGLSTSRLLELGQAAEKRGERHRARRCYLKAILAARSEADGRSTPMVLRWIARTLISEASNDEALEWLGAAVTVAEAWGDESSCGSAINMQAIVKWQMGDLDDAERLYLAARARAVSAGDAKLAAMTAQNLGVIATVRGEHTEARRHYEASLAEYRVLGLNKDAAGALNNLGLLHSHQQQWHEAEAAFREAIVLADSIDDLAARTSAEVNFAEMWVMRQRYAQAEQCVRSALSLASRIGDASALGQATKLLGIIARETGDPAEADAHFRRAADVAESRKDLLLQAEVAREAGELARRQGRNAEVLACLNRAHRLFTQLRARRDLADIDLRTGRLEDEFEQVARRWGESIEATDRYTQGHCVRVADLSGAIAEELGMPKQDLFWFRIGALLHDVGKIIIPEYVLNKPGRFDEEEWRLMKSHTTAGVEMLANIEFPWDVIPVVRSHHERWDGKGYPDQLAGEDIPLVARILCVADVYDALTSVRSYKRALSHAQAVELMRRDIGTMFDPYVFAAFDRVAPRWAHAESQTKSGVIDENAEADTTDYAGSLDDLTGLPQRRAFRDTAERLLAARGAAPRPLSLLVIDLDFFKQVNDLFGHQGGDAALVAVANALRGILRSDDYAARYAGDEFVVLLPGARLASAVATAERLRAAVDALRVPAPAQRGGEIHISISVGVATAPEQGDTLDTLFAAADGALYAAKRRGRNVVATAGMTGAEIGMPTLLLNAFVGRQTERERVRRIFEETVNGRAQLLCVSGEAGIGKSSLVQQLAPDVAIRGGAMVVGRCLEADVRPPFGPWGDLLAQLPLTAAVTERRWTELARLVPGIGARQPSSGNAADARESRYTLLREIQDFVTLASRERPLVLFLEDMQWADDGTWDVLELLVGSLREQRILLVASVRPEDINSAAAARLGRLARAESFLELTLPRLRAADVGQWLRQMFSGQPAEPALLTHLMNVAEGNPLYTLHTMRMLADDGRVAFDGQRWMFASADGPTVATPVRELLRLRLDRLPERTCDILRSAALIGSVFDADVLLQVANASESAVVDALDDAVDAHLIVPEGNVAAARYRFTPALLAEVLASGMSRLRARRMHEQIARALALHQDANASDIARHFADAGCRAEAMEFTLRSADRASSVYAFDTLARCLARAVQLAETTTERAAVHWRLARMHEAAGHLQEAEQAGLQLTGPLREGAERTGLYRSARRLVLRMRLLQGTPAREVLGEFEALLAEAVAANDTAESVAVLLKLSDVHTRLGEIDAARTRAEQAVRASESLDDPLLVAESILRLGSAILPVSPGDATRYYREACNRFVFIGDRRGELRSLINLGVANDRAGNTPAAERHYREAVALGSDVHAADLSALVAMNLGVLLMKTGEYAEARQHLDDAQTSAATHRNEALRLTASYNLAHLALEQRNDEGARARYAECREAARQQQQQDIEVGAVAGVALAELRLGNVASARVLFLEATQLQERLGDDWFQGRERLEALRTRLHMLDARGDEVIAGVQQTLEQMKALEPFATIWFAADCMMGVRAQPALASAMLEATRRQSALARALGYTPLIERFGSSLHLVA